MVAVHAELLHQNSANDTPFPAVVDGMVQVRVSPAPAFWQDALATGVMPAGLVLPAELGTHCHSDPSGTNVVW